MLDLSVGAPARRRWVLGFFAALLALGLGVFRDYGVSFDEEISRNNGMITLKHVAQKVAPAWVASHPDFAPYWIALPDYIDRDYGVAFEAPVSLLEQLLGLHSTRAQFRFRHLCTFLVCFGGIIAVYQLAARRFTDWRLGLLAAAWLVLSPRLFAESFYNDKDAVFMALFALATNTGVRLLLRPTWGRAAWHALACAVTIDVRIMGVLLPVATLALLAWRAAQGELRWAAVARAGALYVPLLGGLVVLLWPYLWPAPWPNFAAAFANMSSFRWGGLVLYRGTVVWAPGLPWHYPLVWVAITTPLLYLGSALLGIVLVVKNLTRHGWRLWAGEAQVQDVLFLGLCLGPLVAVLALHSVLYDGWRQLYFIYPALLLLALRGWVEAARWRPRWAGWPRAWGGLTVACMAGVAGQMVRDHPLQNVYFNALAGAPVAERYELDYWGVGYKQDVEYIVAHDARALITVFSTSGPGNFNAQTLRDAQRTRLKFVNSPAEADYLITDYRGHPEPYPYEHEVFRQRVGGLRVHSVFKLRW